MKNELLSFLPREHPWAEYLNIHNCVRSTNEELKRLAEAGAPQGTTVIARQQTAGRGRMGRNFDSQKDKGLYISCLLRPGCAPTDLMHLTCAVGVAVCNAVSNACNASAKLKWINDLVLDSKKLGGILTELSTDPKTGLVGYAIVGIGINCLQETFPEDLSQIATSLLLATGITCTPAHLAACLLEELVHLSRTLLTDKEQWMESYRHLCVTLGREVKVLAGNDTYLGVARDITEDGSLTVTLYDGTVKTVTSGEASVRGLFGYL